MNVNNFAGPNVNSYGSPSVHLPNKSRSIAELQAEAAPFIAMPYLSSHG